VSSDFDEGSFPKARGWLLAFSSVLIALWFFDADLTSVSLLGTKIEFRRNTEHIWLIALAINFYLMLRFNQHQPNISYSSSAEYQRYYESFMLSSMLQLKHKSINGELLQLARANISPALANATIKSVIERSEFKRFTDPSEKRRYIIGLKEVIAVHAYGLVTGNEDGTSIKTVAYQIDRVCPYWLIRLCIWISKAKLCIRTSYATEHLLPYIWGGFSIIICLIRWITATVS
jgi:hypothetical protein